MNNLIDKREELFYPFRTHFDKVFDNFFSNGLSAVKSQSGYPKLDLIDGHDEFRVEAIIPGVDPSSDLKVEIIPYEGEGNGNGINRRLLRISGKMDKRFETKEGDRFLKKELTRTQFSRSILLDSDLVGEPTAEYDLGVLKLTWKKTPKAEKPEVKLIPIQITKKA